MNISIYIIYIVYYIYNIIYTIYYIILYYIILYYIILYYIYKLYINIKQFNWCNAHFLEDEGLLSQHTDKIQQVYESWSIGGGLPVASCLG